MKVVHQNDDKKKEVAEKEETTSLYGILKELPNQNQE